TKPDGTDKRRQLLLAIQLAGHKGLWRMRQGGQRQEQKGLKPGYTAEGPAHDKPIGLQIDALPFALELAPAAPRRMTNAGQGRIADPEGFGRGPMRPIHILRDAGPERTDGFENRTAAKEIAASHETLLLHIALHVEGKDAFEGFSRRHPFGVLHQDIHAAPRNIAILERLDPFRQPYRVRPAIRIDKGE